MPLGLGPLTLQAPQTAVLLLAQPEYRPRNQRAIEFKDCVLSV